MPRKAEAALPVRLANVAVSGKRSQISPMEDTSAAAIAAALDQVGARLKRLRAQRGMTLTGVAAATGISKSTLSRLETGQRRPTLELLLALSHTYRVPLDDLVGAPAEGDPRVRLKPGRVKGRTVIPLTQQPDGMQAWKIVIPTSKMTPEPRAHDGYEWIYVLSGQYALRPRRPRLRARAGRSRLLRHHSAALVRQHRRRTRRDPQHLRTTRRTHDGPDFPSIGSPGERVDQMRGQLPVPRPPVRPRASATELSAAR